jgi:hypothetical protein
LSEWISRSIPTRTKWVKAAFYGISPDPRSDVIWGQSMGPGFSRIDQPSLLVRLIPGNDPPHTVISEIFQPPEGAFGSRGLDVDLNGIVWTVLSSGHLASFDRSKCKSSLKGPDAATGKQCFEGGRCTASPARNSKASTRKAAPITPIMSGSISTTRSVLDRTCR